MPADHIVHFILDAVEEIPLSHFHVNHRGTGSEQYPPAMMLALLIYCYATGRFGSRTIEAATHSDVAVRYLCANTHPDHDSICAFRAAHAAAFRAAFVSVLQLAHHLRLTRVGTVSVDGTRIQANASKHAAVSCQRAGEMIAQLELEVAQLIKRAQQAQARETQGPWTYPPNWCGGRSGWPRCNRPGRSSKSGPGRWPRPNNLNTRPKSPPENNNGTLGKSRTGRIRRRPTRPPIRKHNSTLPIQRAES